MTTWVHATEAVLHGIASCALEAVPNEAGGALLGWREGAGVNVMDFIEVQSARPARARYELGIIGLNNTLADYLSKAADARVGYVGSWHSHPVPSGPSLVDRHTFRKTGRAHALPLAFLVAATNGRSTTFHTTWAGWRGSRYRLVPQATLTRSSGG